MTNKSSKSHKSSKPKKSQAEAQAEKNTVVQEETSYEEIHAEVHTETHQEEVQHQEVHAETHHEEVEPEETHLQFPYSELIRAYVPKAMNMADKVADDWKKDGSFSNLGIENPYANMAVSLGLKKAKEIEKKLDEKGVLSAVRMGVEVLKQQVQKRK